MKISNVNVYGLGESILVSGYPMKETEYNENEFRLEVEEIYDTLRAGNTDSGNNKHINRAFRLAKAKIGSGHDCMLKGIIVQMDVKAPQYFWQQLQRYHFIDTISSMSKMHSINKMAFNDLCNDYVTYQAIDNAKEAVKYYDAGELNIDECLSNIPMGLEYTARLTTNYLQLKTIYKQRRTHRSMQWQVFCDWIKTLPYANQLIILPEVTQQ